MDNNQTWEKQQHMDNWKKEILMDPILNTLCDQNVPVQQFLQRKVYCLTHTKIAALYSKLSSLNFDISECLQKSVESKSQLIEKSYIDLMAYKSQAQEQSEIIAQKNQPNQYLNYLRSFNKKYESVQNSLLLWKNVTECMHFAKALQSFKININILKSSMMGYNSNETTINAIKISKIIRDLTNISIEHDFNGLNCFQMQRNFVVSTKNIIYSNAHKNVPKLLADQVNGNELTNIQKQQMSGRIIDWINALNNLIGYGKNLLQELAQNIKKYIKNDIQNLASNLESELIPLIYQSCKILIYLQQKLVVLRKIQISNIPNLFTRFWQKLCQFLKQTISWIKRDNQKSVPKHRLEILIWKYPAFYINFSNLCSNVQIYLLQNTTYNYYNFAKNKQRLMVTCLMDLANQYHSQKSKISDMNKLLISLEDSISHQSQQVQNLINSRIQKYISDLSILLEQSKCAEIYNSILKTLCEKLQNLNQLSTLSSQPSNSQKNDQKNKENVTRQYNCQLILKLKRQLKQILIKYGQNYGIGLKFLQNFRK